MLFRSFCLCKHAYVFLGLWQNKITVLKFSFVAAKSVNDFLLQFGLCFLVNPASLKCRSWIAIALWSSILFANED